MNRTTKTIVQALIAIAIMAVASGIVYFVGGQLAKSFIGTEGVTHAAWMKQYAGLVQIAGIGNGILLLCWLVLARFVFKADDPLGAGKRTPWAVLLGLSALFSIIVEYAYHGAHHDLVTSPLIFVLFLLFYTLAGFWGGSLFVTPDAYKYTPLGGAKFRSRKGRAK